MPFAALLAVGLFAVGLQGEVPVSCLVECSCLAVLELQRAVAGLQSLFRRWGRGP